MNSSAYWSSKIDYYQANQPPKAESFYNQSFVDKINEAEGNIDNLVADKDKSWAAYNQSRDDYDAFKGTMSSYDEVYTQSKSKFGIEEKHRDYEESKKALAMAETTLEALPSSINSMSNRVLTQSQREARYNAMADSVLARRDRLMASTDAYKDVWKRAREQQAAYTAGEISAQYSNLNLENNAYIDAINEYTNAGKRLTQGKIELLNWQEQYRNWQHNQSDMEFTIWVNNLKSAVSRFREALKTENAMLQYQSQMNKANSAKGTTFDFGGGYTIVGSNGGDARYYYNGNSISAGRFLEATGANGAQWDKWNSIWNSGIRTKGVGSDTVGAFDRVSAAGGQYNYLFT